ncbi:MAG: serine hydrolase [Candidatus Marinimicrobia bacterium]|jgi:CubicO group peptidase (beta-lactamase class C family)|nr:serine hydrolase [Candidatus Neomarinimicrobiota bacterium]MDD5708946.1 serine hydrolase [Candidatus Neomarinimicrobiota bacterium]MDX9777647.1 serine hydrolase [bacterium]
MKKVIAVILVLVLFISCGRPDLGEADSIIEKAIQERVFPGAVLLVGTSDKILYEKAYGHHTYAEDSPKVTRGSLFDLASLTKVFATSMCAMKAIDSGLIDPEDFVVDYLPEFNNHGKDQIRIKHLLMHNSGMPSYTRALATREETLESIMEISMNKAIGDYTYSCLNFITLMRVIESASGKMMWEFYNENFTDPMRLKHTFFVPDESLWGKCLPTIGDSSGTQVKLQGKVHDPLALALEGYSGNAGLFSTASDLAAFCQLMLNEGEYKGRRYVRPETIEPFKTVQDGFRSYGWGVNNTRSSAGSKMAKTAIGHTGYTGTSAWIDLERDVFVILLTNRVYPQDTAEIFQIRRAVADASMSAMFGL